MNQSPFDLTGRVGPNGAYIGISGPFYYGDQRAPMAASRIKRPAQAMIYMDSIDDYTESLLLCPLGQDPVSEPYNFGRPRVHNDGANLTAADGHVERVKFKVLYDVRTSAWKEPTSLWWYME